MIVLLILRLFLLQKRKESNHSELILLESIIRIVAPTHLLLKPHILLLSHSHTTNHKLFCKTTLITQFVKLTRKDQNTDVQDESEIENWFYLSQTEIPHLNILL